MHKCNSYCLYYPHSDRIPDYIIDKNGVKHVMNSKKYNQSANGVFLRKPHRHNKTYIPDTG